MPILIYTYYHPLNYDMTKVELLKQISSCTGVDYATAALTVIEAFMFELKSP